MLDLNRHYCGAEPLSIRRTTRDRRVSTSVLPTDLGNYLISKGADDTMENIACLTCYEGLGE